MPTRALRDFLPLVMPYAEACPYPVAVQAIRLAAVEWCERTRCWRAITTLTVDEQNESMVAPEYAAIHEIERAEFSNAEADAILLTPTQYSEFDSDQLAEPVADATSGPPYYITQRSPNTVALIPYAAGTLELTLFLKPRSGPEFGPDGSGGTLTDAQNIMPDHVFQQDAEAIAHGALHRILSMPAAPWADRALASFHFERFEARADAKFRSQIRGQQRARKRTTSKWF